MAITVDQIIEFVEALKIRYTRRDDDVIVISSGDAHHKQSSFIWPIKGEKTFFMSTHIYDKEFKNIKIATDSPHKLAVCEYILMRNYTLTFGSWEISDGNIRFTVRIPLENASMTLEQFKRIVGLILNKQANEMFSELRRVINTGSKEESINDELARLEAELARVEAKLAKLEPTLEGV